MKDVVVGIGEALWDVLPDGKKLGGAPANFAYHVGQFGIPSMVVSAIGNDELGQQMVQGLEDKNLPHLLAPVAYPTGTVQVQIDQDGVPQYDIKKGVAWDHIPYDSKLEKLAHRTRAVCFGSLGQRSPVSRQTIGRFIDTARGEGALVMFDVNLRQGFYSKDLLEESMRRCDIMKINDEELDTVSGMFGFPDIDLRDKSWLLLGRFGMKMLILTCGANGSYVFTPGEVAFLPTPHVDVVDTVGAGDSFTGAFTASILKGESLEEAHRKAVETSAYVCTQAGAMPILSSSITGDAS